MDKDKKITLELDPVTGEYRPRKMRWVEFMARWLDSRFQIPGTNIRFGLDPLLSLFPIFGDLFTSALSGALIYTMYTQGASRNVVIKMILNTTIDAVIGSVPVIGSIFDIFFRANDRNVRLLNEHYYEGKHQGSGNSLLLMVVVVAVLVIIAVIYGVYKLIEFFLDAIG